MPSPCSLIHVRGQTVIVDAETLSLRLGKAGDLLQSSCDYFRHGEISTKSHSHFKSFICDCIDKTNDIF